MRRMKEENGMVMIEAVYVVIIAIVMIFFLLNVGFVYYNRMVVTAIADEAAVSIANNYGYTWKEPFYSYMGENAFRGIDPYRHMNETKLKKSVEAKGRWYTSYLLSDLEWSKEERTDFDDVTVAYGDNEMGMKTVTVTIEKNYPVFSFAPSVFWKLERDYEVEATGVAVCYDPVYRMNTTAFVSEMEKKIVSGTATGKIVNSLCSIVDSIIELMK